MSTPEESSQNHDKPSFQVTDRRFWVGDESMVDRASIPDVKYPTVVEELKRRTEAAEQKLKEKIAALEAENNAFRERMARQVEQRLSIMKGEILGGMLEVVDCLDRALTASPTVSDVVSLSAGIALSRELLLTRLQNAGVERIDCVGQPFDPNLAEAVEMVPVTEPARDGIVLEEVRSGYQIDDRLLRPATVKVGRLVAKFGG